MTVPVEYSTMADEELVKEALRPKRDRLPAFRALVQRHQSSIVGNCRYLTGAPDDAEDIAQEVFTRVYFALGRFEHRSSFKTWLFQIKVNQCLTFLSKRQRRDAVELRRGEESDRQPLAVPPTAERRLLREEERLRVSAVLAELSDTLRVPLVLSDMDGLSYPEIAEVLGIGLSAVKMRVRRAREEFRRRYGTRS